LRSAYDIRSSGRRSCSASVHSSLLSQMIHSLFFSFFPKYRKKEINRQKKKKKL
jgi:hypothetical protein